MRISKQASWRVTPELFRLFLIRVGAFAARIKSPLAEEAFAAGDGEGDHHAVAHLQLLIGGSNLHHFAHRLMAKDVPLFHGRNNSVEDVQVGATDRASRHLDDGISAVLDLRIGHSFTSNVILAVPSESAHGETSLRPCLPRR